MNKSKEMINFLEKKIEFSNYIKTIKEFQNIFTLELYKFSIFNYIFIFK